MNDIPGIVRSEFLTAQNGGTPEGDLQDDLGAAVPGLSPAPDALLEAGAYTFDTDPPFLLPSQCLLVDVSHPTFSGVKQATITASGTYKSLQCGTGSTDGNAALTLTGPNNPPDVAGIAFNYHIDFAAGEGVASTVGTASGTGPLGTGKATTAAINGSGGGAAAGAGHVHIAGQPATVGERACVDSDATDFSLAGSFVLVQTD